MNKRAEYYALMRKQEELEQLKLEVEILQKQALITKSETELMVCEASLDNKISEFENRVAVALKDFENRELSLENQQLKNEIKSTDTFFDLQFKINKEKDIKHQNERLLDEIHFEQRTKFLNNDYERLRIQNEQLKGASKHNQQRLGLVKEQMRYLK